MLGRQEVDTQGTVCDKESPSCFLIVSSVTGLEVKDVCKAASVQFIVRNARGLVTIKLELLHLRTPRPAVSTICLPDFITCDQISHALPPSVLHIASS